MSEKLVIEFDVEKTVNNRFGFGYQEKILKFRNSTTKYKGIVKVG